MNNWESSDAFVAVCNALTELGINLSIANVNRFAELLSEQGYAVTKKFKIDVAIPDYLTAEKIPIHPDFPSIKPPEFIINKPMAISDIKLKWWEDDGQIHVKADHDTPNGAAINVSAASLADALIALGNRLKLGKGKLHDEIWDDMRICGDASIQFKELQ